MFVYIFFVNGKTYFHQNTFVILLGKTHFHQTEFVCFIHDGSDLVRHDFVKFLQIKLRKKEDQH